MLVAFPLLAKKTHYVLITYKFNYWRRLLRDPWTAKRSNQSVPKEIDPECSLEDGWMERLMHRWKDRQTHTKMDGYTDR